MERTVRVQRSLSKQDSIDEEREVVKFEDCSSDPQIEKQNSEESHVGTLHRSRSQNKVKLLVRSHAVREETSPPPDPHQNPDQQNLNNQPKDPSNAQNQQTTNRRHKLRREGSSSDNWEHPPLSRGNSREQYDGGNQIDLHQFIIDTLNRNYKDRMLLLKIESDLISLAKDPNRASHKFAQMSSYQRMLVHRVAAYYNMEHNVDTSGVSVIVNTTKFTQIPDSRFRDFVRDDLLLPEEPRRSILKRDSSSFDETGSFKSGERMLNGDSRRSKSFEEREEEYEKARRRIFNREHSGDGDVDCMDDLQWENDEGVCTQFDHSNRERYQPRLLKVESYESGDTLRANSLRLSVSKSHSFNGYEPPQQTRVLTKQDSGSSMSSRISPSSSGYKSQRSDATLSATPSPTATPNLHTQTGQPYTNADGTIYHYDPANPPRVASDIHQNAQHCITQNQAQQKHDTLDNGAIVSGNISSQQQQHVHEIGKSIIDSGYDSSGSGGYLAPPPICQAPHPQFQQPPNMIPPDSQTQYQPFVYPVQASGPAIPYQYDPRIQDGNQPSDLSSYMMGLSLDNTKTNDTRQIMYWQPQVQSQPGVPIYYNSGPTNGRYQGPPPQSQICPTPQFMPQAPPPPPTAAPPQQSHLPPDHTGCYGTTYSGTGPECLPYAPQTLHMYYAPPYNSTGPASSGQNATQATSGSGGYYSTNVPNCAGPILAVQYPQPCPHPTPPHTPQGVCSQFAVYNGCYSSHYSQSNSTLPVPQLFRKQALQVGVRCNSPMRPQYPASPSVKDRSQDDKMQPVPVYGFRVLPGDMRLLGNTGRGIPFALPTPSKAQHARKHRSKIGSNQGRNNGQHSIERE